MRAFVFQELALLVIVYNVRQFQDTCCQAEQILNVCKVIQEEARHLCQAVNAIGDKEAICDDVKWKSRSIGAGGNPFRDD